MKTKIWIYPLFIIGLLFILLSSCKKSNDDNNSINTPETGTVTDVDGNIYKTVKIGTQWWMAENLKTTKYNDGISIPLVTADTFSNLTTPGYCWYNNDAATYKNTYGALYNWYAVNTGKLAPSGWHVPTDAEWTILTNLLGGDSIAGGKMKEAGITHWLSPNTGANNSSGFSGLPGGARYHFGMFLYVGREGSWWSATEWSLSYAWLLYLSYNNPVALHVVTGDKYRGVSVRCVMN